MQESPPSHSHDIWQGCGEASDACEGEAQRQCKASLTERPSVYRSDKFDGPLPMPIDPVEKISLSVLEIV